MSETLNQNQPSIPDYLGMPLVDLPDQYPKTYKALTLVPNGAAELSLTATLMTAWQDGIPTIRFSADDRIFLGNPLFEEMAAEIWPENIIQVEWTLYLFAGLRRMRKIEDLLPKTGLDANSHIRELLRRSKEATEHLED